MKDTQIVSKDSLVFGEKGIISIDSEAEKEYDTPIVDTIKITTNQGFTIEALNYQKIAVLDIYGNLINKNLGDINSDDIVAIKRGADIWGVNNAIDKDLSYAIGLLIGDGYLAGQAGGIGFTKSDDLIREKYIEIMEKSFKDYDIKINSTKSISKNTYDIRFHNVTIKKKLREEYGLKMTKSEFKEIPHTIMTSSREVVINCLQGLFDTDGSIYQSKKIVEYCSKSKRLILQMQCILLNLGIVARVKERVMKNYEDNIYYYLYIGGSNAKLFKKLVDFKYSTHKKEKLNSCLPEGYKSNDNIHVFYNQAERIKRIRSGCLGKDYYNSKSSQLDRDGIRINLKDYTNGKRNTTKQSIHKLLSIIDFTNEDTNYLKMLSDNIFFDKIKSIEVANSSVHSFSAREETQFICNGFILSSV